MKNNKIKRIILFILIVAWAILVFNMSNQNGDESSGLSQKVTAIFCKTEETVNLVEPYVRKLAHFSEYALGGILFFSLFLTFDWSETKQIFVSIGFGIWYASMDEIHQLFIPDRSGSIKDVFIDSLGVSVGICALMILYKFVKKLKMKKLSEKVKK